MNNSYECNYFSGNSFLVFGLTMQEGGSMY